MILVCDRSGAVCLILIKESTFITSSCLSTQDTGAGDEFFAEVMTQCNQGNEFKNVIPLSGVVFRL